MKRKEQDMLEFLVIPVGDNYAAANEAVWAFLSARGEGTPDRAKYSIASKGREVSGIRVTRSEMEAIREAAKTFDFHFNILSVNTRTEEVREHLSTCLNPFPLIHRGSEIPQSNSSTGQHILDVAPSRDI